MLDFLKLSQCNISGFIFSIANNLSESRLYFSRYLLLKKPFISHWVRGDSEHFYLLDFLELFIKLTLLMRCLRTYKQKIYNCGQPKLFFIGLRQILKFFMRVINKVVYLVVLVCLLVNLPIYVDQKTTKWHFTIL